MTGSAVCSVRINSLWNRKSFKGRYSQFRATQLSHPAKVGTPEPVGSRRSSEIARGRYDFGRPTGRCSGRHQGESWIPAQPGQAWRSPGMPVVPDLPNLKVVSYSPGRLSGLATCFVLNCDWMGTKKPLIGDCTDEATRHCKLILVF